MNDLRFDPDTLTGAQCGRYSLIDDMVEMVAPTPARYDLRTAPEQQQDDVAALRAEVAALRTELARQAELLRLSVGPVDVALEVNRLRDEMQYLRLRLDRMEDGGK